MKKDTLGNYGEFVNWHLLDDCIVTIKISYKDKYCKETFASIKMLRLLKIPLFTWFKLVLTALGSSAQSNIWYNKKKR